MSTKTPAVGESFSAVYPFVRDTYTSYDFEPEGVTTHELPTWKPGVRHADKGEGDVESLADGLGQMVLTVVSVHKPGRYPTRVFFTRQWITPEGKLFGKAKCRMTTVGAFFVLSRGYRHEYVLAGCGCDGCAWPYRDHRLKGHRAAELEVTA
jgi:hypothetical protein